MAVKHECSIKFLNQPFWLAHLPASFNFTFLLHHQARSNIIGFIRIKPLQSSPMFHHLTLRQFHVSSSSAQSIQEKPILLSRKRKGTAAPGQIPIWLAIKSMQAFKSFLFWYLALLLMWKEKNPILLIDENCQTALLLSYIKYIVLLGDRIFSLTNKMEKEMPPQSRRFPENYQSFHYDIQ